MEFPIVDIGEYKKVELVEVVCALRKEVFPHDDNGAKFKSFIEDNAFGSHLIDTNTKQQLAKLN